MWEPLGAAVVADSVAAIDQGLGILLYLLVGFKGGLVEFFGICLCVCLFVFVCVCVCAQWAG